MKCCFKNCSKEATQQFRNVNACEFNCCDDHSNLFKSPKVLVTSSVNKSQAIELSNARG